MKLYSVTGNSQRLDGGSMFGNVPRAMWQSWVAPDERHRVPLACRALLVQDMDGLSVLFETGIGAFFDPKLRDRYGVQEDRHVLLESLADLGLGHEDIDVVVLSHLHFDHAGGLLSEWRDGQDSELLFPNARYVVGESHWRRACDPHPRDRASFIPRLNELLDASGRMELVDGDSTPILGDRVRFSYSEGHTPGLMLSEIRGPEDRGGVVFCADLIPGRPWIHLPVTMGYDRYPEKLIDEKRVFLQDKLDRGIGLFFTHDHECSLAHVVKDDRGRFGTGEELAELQGLVIANL